MLSACRALIHDVHCFRDDDADCMQDSAARAAAIAKGKSEETTPIKLTYSFSVQHKLTASRVGILNDLVLVSDDELYVTQVT